MPETPAEFHARATSTADSDGRLPTPDLSGWTDVFPFEPDGIRVAKLNPPQPEPDRAGVGGQDCRACTADAPWVWSDGSWRLALMRDASGVLVMMLTPFAHADLGDLSDDAAAEMGRLCVHVTRAVEALPHVARAHIYRVGDGGEHLHLWVFARPAEQLQLRGSYLLVWDDLLAPMPDEVRQADARTVAEALAASYGGQVS